MAALDRTVDGKFVDKLYDKMTHMDEWMRDAACSVTSINMFTHPEKFAELCEGCPVVQQCREVTDTTTISTGVFGGRIIR